ncbi:16S rRNA (cytosine(967)-C(5))-methyltransferase RsmB [Alicyclobacillus tolerans]|uniref:16S rRNA (cytosine(967)-C(5))-methyltransferase RsmB n=1 Tax=Alicyclobacillus tolerans TaxID=90970 RepID=UPI001EFFA77C|nr:16S rRNA (cytosine(967)-C(5))-methyltransferase RsmB [Alicyclobacillus tolerans]MCF8564424.1 16S rRNA (cytosine(967)-C(5))-methyltransferase RsmB [Alicyclobacillus tolerans]
MTSSPRHVAYRALTAVEQGGAFTNLVLQKALQQSGLDPRNKALATEIVYGTIQRKRSLDALLTLYLRRPLAELDPQILTILRMTAYQLGFLDRIPAYAAIHDAVELTKQVQPRAAGLVNGVLRSFDRDPKSAEQRLEALAQKLTGFADRMGVQHSYPTWLVQALADVYGQARTVNILEACNRRAHLSVRVNTLKENREHLLDTLANEFPGGAEASPVSPVGIRLNRGLDVEQWPLYQTGAVSVQDEGAMLIAPLFGTLAPGAKVLDMCAAPGSKTTHIAQMQRDMGQVVAVDIHEHKLRLLEKAAKRLGLGSISTLAMDARDLDDDPKHLASYDAVLLDAPCTGFGVLRHRPDIRWRRTPSDVASLQDLQVELLRTAARVVRPLGTIVYSTCTLLPEENEQVVQTVAADENLQLVVEDIRPYLPEAVRSYALEGGIGLTLTPELFQTDGFYMARLRKKG